MCAGPLRSPGACGLERCHGCSARRVARVRACLRAREQWLLGHQLQLAGCCAGVARVDLDNSLGIDVDGEGHLSDAVESRTSSADQRRRAESRMARRSTMKPNNIREVNRRQIDRDISRPGSRVNIAQGRRTKLAERASGMKTKGDLPIPVPPDPYRAGEGTGTQRRDVRQRADERMRGHEAAESAHEERIYRQGAARRRQRIAAGIPEQDLDWDGSYHNV